MSRQAFLGCRFGLFVFRLSFYACLRVESRFLSSLHRGPFLARTLDEALQSAQSRRTIRERHPYEFLPDKCRDRRGARNNLGCMALCRPHLSERIACETRRHIFRAPGRGRADAHARRLQSVGLLLRNSEYHRAKGHRIVSTRLAFDLGSFDGRQHPDFSRHPPPEYAGVRAAAAGAASHRVIAAARAAPAPAALSSG